MLKEGLNLGLGDSICYYSFIFRYIKINFLNSFQLFAKIFLSSLYFI